MNAYRVDPHLEEVLDGKRHVPTLLLYNRLEGRPRATDFHRALKAEARDALWLLTRQWQMGEFEGDDAGSPVSARVAWTTESVAGVRGRDGTLRALDAGIPLEARVEARAAALDRAGRPHDILWRLTLGRHWRRLLDDAGLAAHVPAYRARFRFTAPDAGDPAGFAVTAHAATWQIAAATAGRGIDGGALLQQLQAGAPASSGLGVDTATASQLDVLGGRFLIWAQARHVQADGDLHSWSPRALDYAVGLSTPDAGAPAALAATDYRGEGLDWFAFDPAPARADDVATAAPPVVASGFVPTPIRFDGMPNTRHWTFEEGRTNFGEIAPDTTDLAKLLLIEFGLVYANDWFMLPIELGDGSLTRIRGLTVTNVFGERTWIDPAVSADGPTRGWQMFRLNDGALVDDRLFLPPVAGARVDGPPVEAVELVRDEVSNMVWGIERLVQLADGSSRPGREAAGEFRARLVADLPAAAPPSSHAPVRYRVMTGVPEHWIPFLPVHVPGDNREIQLQRGGMPRLLEGAAGPPAKIAPVTALLREGLDRPQPNAYFIAEEEVERAGTMLDVRWRRCRGADGAPVVWLAVQRRTGRGESSSTLAFDTLLPGHQ